jgi:hypothetical protein
MGDSDLRHRAAACGKPTQYGLLDRFHYVFGPPAKIPANGRACEQSITLISRAID